MPDRLRAALVDFGGTLIPDERALPLSAARRRARALALESVLPELSLRGRVSLVDNIHRDLLASQAGLVEHAEELIESALGPTLGGRAPAVRRVLSAQLEPKRLYPGSRELLEGMGALGLRRIIVSNAALAPATEYWDRLAELGLRQHVDGLVSSYDVGYRKPHPAIFQAALDQAGCPPEACVMIGDSEVNDIGPAAALGMRTIKVCLDGAPQQTSRADLSATSLDQVAAWLRGVLPPPVA